MIDFQQPNFIIKTKGVKMNIDNINNAIDNENNNYNRALNSLQQQILDLKSRHRRTLENLKYQKQLIKKQNENLVENYNRAVSCSVEELNQKIKQLLEMC